MSYWAELDHSPKLRVITDMGSKIWENWLKARYYSFPGNGYTTCPRQSGFSLQRRGNRATDLVPFR